MGKTEAQINGLLEVRGLLAASSTCCGTGIARSVRGFLPQDLTPVHCPRPSPEGDRFRAGRSLARNHMAHVSVDGVSGCTGPGSLRTGRVLTDGAEREKWKQSQDREIQSFCLLTARVDTCELTEREKS